MRTMMITGDYHHTAIAVAKGAGMVPPAGKLVITQAASEASSAAADPGRQHMMPEHHSHESKLKQAVPQQVQCYSQVQNLRQQQLLLEQRQTRPTLRVQFVAQAASSSHVEQLSVQQTTSGQGYPVSPSAFPDLLLPMQLEAQASSSVQSASADPPGQRWHRQSASSLTQEVVPQQQPHGILKAQHHQSMDTKQSSSPGGLSEGQGTQSEGQGTQSEGQGTQYQRQGTQSEGQETQWEQRGMLQMPHDHHSPLVITESAPHSYACQHVLPQHQLSQSHFRSDHPQDPCASLCFTCEGYSPQDESQSALQALQSIAQGQAQCCVTGQAFDHMLQHAEPAALVQTVMQNAMVFARMHSHQKGQVMELLSSRGLHQIVDGQKRHVPVSCLSLPYAACTACVYSWQWLLQSWQTHLIT